MWLRILTAILLAPVFMASTLWLPTELFAVLIGIIVVVGLWEWSRLSRVSVRCWMMTCGVMLVLMFGLYHFEWMYMACVVGGLYWVFQVYDLRKHGLETAFSGGGFAFHGPLVLTAAWSGLVLLHQNGAMGPVLALGFIVSIWAADSFAYFAGRAFGRHKLAPEISPGKTVEGVIGGAIGALVIAGGFVFLITDFSPERAALWMVLTFFAALISVAGDLYESRLKRLVGAKDSGQLLPGHGGALDRIDGLLAAAPFFVAVFLI